jgi:RNA polymerase sigma factor (sigma-70 family)
MEHETRLRAWLEEARRGDEGATAEIRRVVAQIAHQVVRGRTGALGGGIAWEDVAQEALLRLVRGTATYRGTGSVRGYIYTAVKSSLLQAIRTQRRRERRDASYSAESSLQEASPRGEGAAGPVDLETRRRAEEILAALDPECRDLIEQVFFLGTSYARLAEERGLAESSVRARLSRCLGRARERSR